MITLREGCYGVITYADMGGLPILGVFRKGYYGVVIEGCQRSLLLGFLGRVAIGVVR